MSKYLFLYRGPAVEGPPEADTMTAWTVWMDKVGAALVDPGAPAGARTAVAGDGSTRSATDTNGYSVVQADSIDGARALLDGHPFLTRGDASFGIDVLELLEM